MDQPIEEAQPEVFGEESIFTVLAAHAAAASDGAPCVDLELAGVVTLRGEDPPPADDSLLAQALADGAVLTVRLPPSACAAVVLSVIQGSLDLSPATARIVAQSVSAALASTPPPPGLVLPGLLKPGP